MWTDSCDGAQLTAHVAQTADSGTNPSRGKSSDLAAKKSSEEEEI